MGCAGQIKKSYVEFPGSESQITYLIHVSDQSSEQCKVLTNFGKIIPPPGPKNKMSIKMIEIVETKN